MTDISFHDIDTIDAAMEPFDWELPRTHAREIEAYWQKTAEGKTHFFNGTVLIQHRGMVEGRVFRAAYAPVEYKHFLGFLKLELPSPGIRNGFGMAALRSRDGAFLLGQMGPGTANAGMIYFAAGTPDLGDVRDGRVDIAGSVIREMCEETGLTEADVTIGQGWTCLMLERRVAFMRPVTIDLPADDARALMLDRMRRLKEEELSDIVIIRPGDSTRDARMPPFMQAYLEREFARG